MNYIDGLVSVIMPAYNAEGTISESIDSVLVQTYRSWELLIVDDCSSDETARIVREYAARDSRIHYIKNEVQSHGPTVPRNIAIENAVGRYIAFLDADDQWMPEKLEHQIPLFSMDKKVAVVFSDYRKINNDFESGKNRVVHAPKKVSFNKLLKGNCIGNLTAVYDVSMTGKVFLQKVGHEDYVLWLTILGKGFHAVNTGTVEATYLQRKRSVSGNKKVALQWTWDIFHHILGFNIFKSLYYFSFYALNGLVKYLK